MKRIKKVKGKEDKEKGIYKYIPKKKARKWNERKRECQAYMCNMIFFRKKCLKIL